MKDNMSKMELKKQIAELRPHRHRPRRRPRAAGNERSGLQPRRPRGHAFAGHQRPPATGPLHLARRLPGGAARLGAELSVYGRGHSLQHPASHHPHGAGHRFLPKPPARAGLYPTGAHHRRAAAGEAAAGPRVHRHVYRRGR